MVHALLVCLGSLRSQWRNGFKRLPHKPQDGRLPLPLRTLLVAAVLTLSLPAMTFGWDGVDSSSGGAVEIGKGNLVRSGQTVEVYDYEAGEYRDVDVESIRRSGSSVEVEVYDNESGEYRTFEMDD
ncbi:hypothetical protein REMIM1_PE00160 (plasmid) [Rhizobium etli bv. mimosae str. Mim1]|nr:hypothetical protein REMIM1_PE00160 [Rhizobium etli bv. mimosae str. Mim1]